MIILDTHVLSALMREEPEVRVIKWLDAQAPESIWITSITIFEARFGLEFLPKGKRQRDMAAEFGRLLDLDIENRILDFDGAAAAAAGTMAALRMKTGQNVDIRDTQIAGIALARRATLATRNIRRFQGSKLRLVDPWKFRA